MYCMLSCVKLSSNNSEVTTWITAQRCLLRFLMPVANRLERCLSDVSHWIWLTVLSRMLIRPNFSGSARNLYASAALGSSCPSLSLGDETVTPSDHVPVLGVTFSSDLRLDKHVSSVTAKCFYSLRQLRTVRRFLPIDSLKMLVHAFIM